MPFATPRAYSCGPETPGPPGDICSGGLAPAPCQRRVRCRLVPRVAQSRSQRPSKRPTSACLAGLCRVVGRRRPAGASSLHRALSRRAGLGGRLPRSHRPRVSQSSKAASGQASFGPSFRFRPSASATLRTLPDRGARAACVPGRSARRAKSHLGPRSEPAHATGVPPPRSGACGLPLHRVASRPRSSAAPRSAPRSVTAQPVAQPIHIARARPTSARCFRPTSAVKQIACPRRQARAT